ncbi:hypothetical protein DHB74_04970 [Pseudomonas sp. G11-1]|nr:hypothetical protein [Pseudomonas sp. G11-1]MCO5788193.1 hypothetical protein [Pseudomonas sp. G11-2]
MKVDVASGAGTEQAEQAPGWVDLGAGAFFLLWAAVGWYGLTGNEQLMQVQRNWFVSGPGLLPFWGLVVLTLGGLVMAVKGGWRILRRRAVAGAIAWEQHGFALLMLVSLIALVGSMQVAGFFLSALFFCCCWTLTLSRRIVREAYGIVLTAVGSSFAIAGLLYLVFVELVNVPLP